MQHLEEGTIHAWLDGALDADESSRIERHVAECGECAAAVAEARGLIAGATRIVSSLDVVRGNVLPAQPAKHSGKGSLWRSLRLTPGRAALAATLLIAAATMLSVHRLAPDIQSAGSDLRDGRAPQTAAAAPAPAPTSEQAPAPAPAAKSAAKRVASPATRQLAAPETVRRETPREGRNAAASMKAIEKQRDVPAAPPSPTQADAEKKVSSVAAAQATSTVDSAVARRTEAVGAIGGGGAGRGARGAGAAGGFAAARTNQLSAVVTTGLAAGPVDVLGCYQIKPDSAETFADSRAFPLRFALQQSLGTPNPNVVRAVTSDGRLDSVIAGSRWERLSSNTTNVYWVQDVGASPQTPTLTLRFAGNAISAQAATPTGLKSVGVSRAACRP